jgi:hypothetical protein
MRPNAPLFPLQKTHKDLVIFSRAQMHLTNAASLQMRPSNATPNAPSLQSNNKGNIFLYLEILILIHHQRKLISKKDFWQTIKNIYLFLLLLIINL